jgi:phospholipase/carboxylesterase
MEKRAFGPLEATIAGGTDRRGGGEGPVVVLCHGFGAPGTDLVPLGRVLPAPAGTRWVFPEAPLELPPDFMGGRAWWLIDMMALERAMMTGEVRDLTKQVPEGLAVARASLLEALDAIERELRVPSSRIVLGGFSQGAMLSLDVALHTDRPLAGLVLLSGTLLAEHEWIPRLASRKGSKIFQSHGRADPLLPFSIAERLHDELARAGCDVTWVPFSGMHEIPGVVADGLGAFLQKVLV